MKRKLTALILGLSLGLSLSGCGSVFDKEYLAVSDYNPPAVEAEETEKISVSSYPELREAILQLVSDGESEGTIRFDPGYSGDSVEDIAAASWEIRTQDALCAYCVQNIYYELKKIVNYDEAVVHISYAEGRNAADVVRLRYSSGIKEHIRMAYEAGLTKLAVLINPSSISAESMATLASQVYREYPGSAPGQPKVNVNLFSGNGAQRLYEINISYGMSSEELALRQKKLRELRPFDIVSLEDSSEAERALLACEYLADNCSYDSEDRYSGIYSALILNEADSEGMALAYVDLCQRLGLECIIVYGQYEWQDYCWNIVKAEGEYYHVDIARCSDYGPEESFMLRDEQMWENHRWDRAAYPACRGGLNYSDVAETVK